MSQIISKGYDHKQTELEEKIFDDQDLLTAF